MLLTIMAVVAVITLPPLLVQFLVGTLIPILVAAVTKANASPVLKQFATIFLSAVSALIISSITRDGVAEVTQNALLLAGIGWLQAMASYLGLWKPNDLNNKLRPNSGLGSSTPPTG